MGDKFMKRADAVCIILTVALCVLLLIFYAENAHNGISGAVARLHVLANSDSPEDQAMKLAVRDGILAELYPELNGTEDKSAALEVIGARLYEIETLAGEIVAGLGADYTVKAYIARDYFPTRQYDGITLPAGMYDALRVEIGEAAGQNWWCVMFPPLCFVDMAAGYVEGAGDAEMNSLLTAEGYSLVTGAPKVAVRFKVVELWQEMKNGITNGMKNFFGLTNGRKK